MPMAGRPPRAASTPLARMAELAAALADPRLQPAISGLRTAARRAGCPPSLAALAGAVLAAYCLIPPPAPPPRAAGLPRASKPSADLPLPLLEWLAPPPPAPAAGSISPSAAPDPSHTALAPPAPAIHPAAADCLCHLLAARLDWPTAGPGTVQDRIDAALRLGDAAARRLLIDHGMKLAPAPQAGTGPLHLLVASAHPWLKGVFSGTPWADGWAPALRALDGAVAPRYPVSFAPGIKPRAVAVPLNHFDPAERVPTIQDASPEACLRFLLARHAPGTDDTLLALVTRARRDREDTARRALVDCGMKLSALSQPARNPEFLLIAITRPQFAHAFLATPWSFGRWVECLRRLPGAVTPRHPIHFHAQLKPRVVAIPIDCLGIDEAPPPAPIMAGKSPL